LSYGHAFCGDLRNFAIVGHASSGKTTLSEAMLACAGVIGRMGNIAQGTTVSDWKRSGVVSKYLGREAGSYLNI